jgi:hypothetical protein
MPFSLFQQSIAAIGAQLQGALIFNNEVNIHSFGVFNCCNVALYCCFHMGMGLDHMKHDEVQILALSMHSELDMEVTLCDMMY